MIKTGIYKILNIINNKVYVGSAINIGKRWRDHKWHLNHNKHHNLHLQASWDKYGCDSFEFSILLECNINELLIKETEFIKQFKSNDNNYGYNLNDPEHIFLNRKHSEKTKAILSFQKIGDKNPMFGKKGINHPNYNKEVSIESRQKMSISHVGIPTHRQNNSKLKPSDIPDIRRMYYDEKILQSKIAVIYNVTPSSISNIITGKRWSEVK